MRKERKVHYQQENSQIVDYPAAAACVCVCVLMDVGQQKQRHALIPFFSSHNHDAFLLA